ncbi:MULTISPECIES: mycofactocin-coupled SDR family oxidoreductase [Rhodococcus]|uniref:mycofactocin-coupled SDR family oxidoreductase n=1 Tax=Rhodococcus TaxID=1827 RepID=UPI0022866909|nr:mycofactocin-coupled SDR family oxidoreductase [Rhodococcus sp. JS3073]WAM19679.1 mycofactocin-coupled SDR family oxidoreductase [Rhodococcus sp. JS3073]
MAHTQGRVSGKVALVTGAARGQGRSHCVRLAQEGADIIAIDICRNVDTIPYALGAETDLAETVSLVEESGGRIFARRADVRDREGLTAVVDEGVARFGALDIVSANAGVMSPARTLELTSEMWQDLLDVNLVGVYNTCAAAIPHLIAGKGGSIVLTSSCSGLRGTPNLAHYSAAKHGVVGLMRTLAIELAPEFIRVNTIHTTIVPTGMGLSDAVLKLFRPDLPRPTVEDARAGFAQQNLIPVPWVELDDVSNALLFLASDESRYITGVALPVDAGSMEK